MDGTVSHTLELKYEILPSNQTFKGKRISSHTHPLRSYIVCFISLKEYMDGAAPGPQPLPRHNPHNANTPPVDPAQHLSSLRPTTPDSHFYHLIRHRGHPSHLRTPPPVRTVGQKDDQQPLGERWMAGNGRKLNGICSCICRPFCLSGFHVIVMASRVIYFH